MLNDLAYENDASREDKNNGALTKVVLNIKDSGSKARDLDCKHLNIDAHSNTKSIEIRIARERACLVVRHGSSSKLAWGNATSQQCYHSIPETEEDEYNVWRGNANCEEGILCKRRKAGSAGASKHFTSC